MSRFQKSVSRSKCFGCHVALDEIIFTGQRLRVRSASDSLEKILSRKEFGRSCVIRARNWPNAGLHASGISPASAAELGISSMSTQEFKTFQFSRQMKHGANRKC